MPPRRYGNPNLTTPLYNHPHAGAVDEFGHFGYVHDPTILHHTQPTFHVPEHEKTDLCAPPGYGPEGWQELGRQFFVDHIQVASPSPESKDVKIFCAVYTHPQKNNETEAIRETWGKRCDGFMAASTETIHNFATVNLPHQGPFEGQYKGIWQRVRSIVAYFHSNFIDDYDYLYLCGDDTYVILENLKAFLASPKVVEHATTYFYTGARTVPNWGVNNEHDPSFFFMGGGAGYILNQNLVRAIVEHVLPNCHDDTIGSAEVRQTSCLCARE